MGETGRWTVGAAAALTLAALVAVPAPATGQAEAPICVFDIAFVFDKSASMKGPPTDAAEKGAVHMVNLMGPKDRTGLRTFYDETDNKAPDSDHDATRAGILKRPPTQPPAELYALYASQQSATAAARDDLLASLRPEARAILLVVSDGENDGYVPEAQAAKDAGIIVASLAIGDYANTADMRAQASGPDFFRWAATGPAAKDAMDHFLSVLFDCNPMASAVVLQACVEAPVVLEDTSTPGEFPPLEESTWTFGDGSDPLVSGPHAMVEHDYAEPGNYTVRLVVEVARGFRDIADIVISVRHCPPEPAFACDPLPGRKILLQDSTHVWFGTLMSYHWDLGEYGEDSGRIAAPRVPRDTGDIPVRLTVTDEFGQQASSEKLCTPGPDLPPVIAPPHLEESHSAMEGILLAFDVVAVDPEGDPLTWSWDPTGLPDRATFVNGHFSWQTQPGDGGVYTTIPIKVSDGLHADGIHEVGATLGLVVFRPSGDGDADGVSDRSDNCSGTANRDQGDTDSNGAGDACQGGDAPTGGAGGDGGSAGGGGGGSASSPDTAGAGTSPPPGPADFDADGREDSLDNCPAAANADQTNLDGDPEGDACDLDADGDQAMDGADNCARLSNPGQVDADGDGLGDLCDAQDDSQVLLDGEPCASCPADSPPPRASTHRVMTEAASPTVPEAAGATMAFALVVLATTAGLLVASRRRRRP